MGTVADPKTTIQQFGITCLDSQYRLDTLRLSLIPVEDWALENDPDVLRFTGANGYFDPPMARYKFDLYTRKPVKIIGSARMFRLPTTHRVETSLNSDTSDLDMVNHFIIAGLCSYVFARPVYPSDWYYHLPIQVRNTPLIIGADIQSHFVTSALERYVSESPKTRRAIAEFMWLLAHRYMKHLFLWEQYTPLSIAWDRAVTILEQRHSWKRCDGRRLKFLDRMKRICSEYGILYPSKDKNILKKWHIASLHNYRNALFHEGYYGGSLLGRGGPGNGTYEATLMLANLLERIVLAIFDYRNDYLKSLWVTRSRMRFSKSP